MVSVLFCTDDLFQEKCVPSWGLRAMPDPHQRHSKMVAAFSGENFTPRITEFGRLNTESTTAPIQLCAKVEGDCATYHTHYG